MFLLLLLGVLNHPQNNGKPRSSLHDLSDQLPSHRPRKLLVINLETFILSQNQPFPSAFPKDFSFCSDAGLLHVRPCPNLYKLLSCLSPIFCVGIWSDMTSMMAIQYICQHIFGDRLVFTYSQNDAKQVYVNKPYPVFLKLVTCVAIRNPGFSSSNILFLDKDATCLIQNPHHTYLCPPSYTLDNARQFTFLVDILLPYLNLLGDAWDIRCFIKNHHPRWSLNSIQMQKTTASYKMLTKLQCLPSRSDNLIPNYSLIFLSPHEIPYELRKVLQELHDEYLRVKKIQHEKLSLHELSAKLGFHHYVQSIEGFNEDLRIRMQYAFTTWLVARWDLFPMGFRLMLHHPVSFTCKRDLRVDPYGTRGTCSTFACENCGRQTPLVLNEVPPPCVSPPNSGRDRGRTAQYSQEFEKRFLE